MLREYLQRVKININWDDSEDVAQVFMTELFDDDTEPQPGFANLLRNKAVIPTDGDADEDAETPRVANVAKIPGRKKLKKNLS